MGAVNKLTVKQIENVSEPGRYGDGRGLWLQVSKWRTKSWLFRYSLGVEKVSKSGKKYVQTREMGLGPVSLAKHDGGVTLAEAREKRDSLHRLLREGIDPINHRLKVRRDRLREASARISFKLAAEEYISMHEPTWRNAKHRQQWGNTLKTYVYGKVGTVPVSDIDDALINEVIEPIWKAKNETAKRVRTRIRLVCKWIADGRPPPKEPGVVENQPAMRVKDIPGFMAELRDRDSVSARALEFLILTAARTGATIGAIWDEVDLEKRVWTVPAGRTGSKAYETRQVALSARVVEILLALPRERGNPHVFIGATEGGGLSGGAMSELLKGMHAARKKAGLPTWADAKTGRLAVPHGFRSSFRDWAAEQTNYRKMTTEAALWHAAGDSKVEKAYLRTDLLEKRRALMEDWARYCVTPLSAGKIVSLQSARA